MNNKGFTLIELIVAFSISLLLILLIFSGFRLSSRSYEKITEREASSQRIRSIYKRVGWLISGLYPYKRMDKNGKERLFFVGGREHIGFITTSVIRETGRISDLSGLKWVYLFVDNDGLKEVDNIYFLEENLEASSDRNAIVLDPDVRSLRIEYLEPESNTWVESWDEENENLPPAIKIKLELKEGVSLPEMVFSIRTWTQN